MSRGCPGQPVDWICTWNFDSFIWVGEDRSKPMSKPLEAMCKPRPFTLLLLMSPYLEGGGSYEVCGDVVKLSLFLFFGVSTKVSSETKIETRGPRIPIIKQSIAHLIKEDQSINPRNGRTLLVHFSSHHHLHLHLASQFHPS